MNKKTAKQIEIKKNQFNKLQHGIEMLIGQETMLQINNGNGSRSDLEIKINNLIDSYDLDISDVAREELETEREVRIKRFANNNIDKVSDTEDVNVLDKVKDKIKNNLIFVTTLSLLQFDKNVANYELGYNQSITNQAQNEVTIEQIAKEKGIDLMSHTYIDDDGVIYFVFDSGRKMQMNYYVELQLRSYYSEQSFNNLLSDANAYGHDLVRTSAHADCSDLCYPYQGRIYSLSGLSKKHPKYSDILFWNGGGYDHPNCRHHTSIYIEGASDENLYDDILGLDKDIVEKNYQERQNRKYNERQANKYSHRATKADSVGDKVSATKYRNKAKNFRNKA